MKIMLHLLDCMVCLHLLMRVVPYALYHAGSGIQQIERMREIQIQS